MINKYLKLPKLILGSFVFLFILISCSKFGKKNYPNYLNKIEFINDYKYYTVKDYSGLVLDSLYTNELKLDSKKNLILKTIGDIEDIDSTKFLISDNIFGVVYLVKSKEINATKFVSQGRGPNEVLAPTLLNKSMYKEQEAIYILDTNLKTLVITDTTGREIQRYSNKNIPNSITANKMYISNDNSFIWPSYNNQDYVLAEWDSLGNLKRELAKRLINQGKQPESHNTIIFDFKPKEDILSFSYIGIPLIFVEDKGQKKVINLFPDKEIEEFNIGLEELPYDKNTRVNRIIRSVDFVKDIILVSTKEFLYIIPNSFDKKIKMIKLFDSKGDKAIYHNLKVTNENIYFINLYNQNINKISLENFVEFYSK